MDEILKQTLLYDFYGELLTKHQKEIYEQAVRKRTDKESEKAFRRDHRGVITWHLTV